MSGALQQAQSRTTEASWIPGVASLAKHQRMGEAVLFPWKPNCNEKETKRNLHRQHQVWLRESLKVGPTSYTGYTALWSLHTHSCALSLLQQQLEQA